LFDENIIDNSLINYNCEKGRKRRRQGE